MFYVYDNNGLKFSGLLEKLVTRRKVPASQATKKAFSKTIFSNR